MCASLQLREIRPLAGRGEGLACRSMSRHVLHTRPHPYPVQPPLLGQAPPGCWSLPPHDWSLQVRSCSQASHLQRPQAHRLP